MILNMRIHPPVSQVRLCMLSNVSNNLDLDLGWKKKGRDLIEMINEERKVYKNGNQPDLRTYR